MTRAARTAVIVQARMSSSRLPGKVLADLAGEPVLAHVLRRCRSIPGADVVCCATVEGDEGDEIAIVAEKCGAVVTRGSRDDVLDRYVRAARAVDADVVVRVTSDCPLVDPEVCGQVLKLLRDSGSDLACNNMPPSWPYGLDCEAIVVPWLERAAREAVNPFDREHVTPYIRTHFEARKVNLVGPGGDAARQHWAVDHPEDLEFIRNIFAQLPGGPEGYDYRYPLRLAGGHVPAKAETDLEDAGPVPKQ